MTADDLTTYLIERVPCPRCRTALNNMSEAMTPGALVSEGAREMGHLHILIAACTAAGHPGAWQDRVPSRLDDPPDKADVQPAELRQDVTPLGQPPGSETLPTWDTGIR